MRHKLFLILFSTFVTLVHAPAFAGSEQGPVQSDFSYEEAAIFAKRVEQYAAQEGARIFILARLGSPQEQLPEGIHFTHVGLAVYSSIQTQEGDTLKGYAIHNLYQDPNDLSRSRLVVDYPMDFFLGSVQLKAGIIIPTPALQQKLFTALDQGLDQTLHNPRYSMIANPYSSRYQNCTEHVLDLIFAALYATDSPAQIKANQRAYFKAHPIAVSPFKRLLAPIFSSDIQMNDQDKSIQVATFTSIGNFMTHYGLSKHMTILEPEKTSLN